MVELAAAIATRTKRNLAGARRAYLSKCCRQGGGLRGSALTMPVSADQPPPLSPLPRSDGGRAGQRGDAAQIRQSRPDSGLGFQVEVLGTLYGVASSLGSGMTNDMAQRERESALFIDNLLVRLYFIGWFGLAPCEFDLPLLLAASRRRRMYSWFCVRCTREWGLRARLPPPPFFVSSPHWTP